MDTHQGGALMAQLPGERLKEERNRQQLTERQAADKLHLSLSYVRALEADNYEQLPEATFIKGYFRNYARLLGLPADEVTAAFEALQAEQAPVTAQDAQEKAPLLPQRQLVWGIVALVLVVIVMGWWLSTPAANDVSATDASVPPVEASASAPAVLESPGAEQPATDATATPATTNATDATSAATPAAASTTSTSSAAAASDSSQVAPSAQLTVVFSADCWVVVTDAAGKNLFKGARGAGSELNLSGQAPFQLMLGNAAGVVRVSVNGKTVDLPQAAAGEVINLQAP